MTRSVVAMSRSIGEARGKIEFGKPLFHLGFNPLFAFRSLCHLSHQALHGRNRVFFAIHAKNPHFSNIGEEFKVAGLCHDLCENLVLMLKIMLDPVFEERNDDGSISWIGGRSPRGIVSVLYDI